MNTHHAYISVYKFSDFSLEFTHVESKRLFFASSNDLVIINRAEVSKAYWSVAHLAKCTQCECEFFCRSNAASIWFIVDSTCYDASVDCLSLLLILSTNISHVAANTTYIYAHNAHAPTRKICTIERKGKSVFLVLFFGCFYCVRGRIYICALCVCVIIGVAFLLSCLMCKWTQRDVCIWGVDRFVTK